MINLTYGELYKFFVASEHIATGMVLDWRPCGENAIFFWLKGNQTVKITMVLPPATGLLGVVYDWQVKYE